MAANLNFFEQCSASFPDLPRLSLMASEKVPRSSRSTNAGGSSREDLPSCLALSRSSDRPEDMGVEPDRGNGVAGARSNAGNDRGCGDIPANSQTGRQLDHRTI